MKKRILLLSIFCITLLSEGSIKAGGGDFWGGMALGTTTGVLASRPWDRGRHTKEVVYVNDDDRGYGRRRRRARSLDEREFRLLREENEDLASQIEELKNEIKNMKNKKPSASNG